MDGQSWGPVEIRVSTAELRRQAAEVSRRVESLAARFSELENTVNSTKGYWIGEGGELHRRFYAERRDDIEAMLRRLREHPASLLKISGNYEQTEEAIADSFGTLRGDAIN